MNDAAGRARQGGRRALGVPLIKKCAILATGNALDQLYAGKCDECCVGDFTSPLSSDILLCTVRYNFRQTYAQCLKHLQ
ncbi:hypothetical protein DYL61_14780 [Pseudomonas nabeulensis]|uniref:Uncharacterized protein n=1 Tax=Pseudomonas nabeulensis TaxID=2293833 RepID=A0A4Z0B2M6_9PSED|nr:hypothetical protein DYL61_14780 [Pseudomonas nabeulensis]